MEKVVPVLPARDAEEAKAFYVGKLGFTVDFEWRHEPGFPAQIGIQSGDIYLHLSEHAKAAQGSEIYIFVNDIATWHKQCVDSAVNIEQGPDKMPWGNTEMLIKDPHGNALRISQIGTHQPTAKSAKPPSPTV